MKKFLFLAMLATQADAESYRLFVSNEYGANLSVISPEAGPQGEVSISGRPGDVRPRGMALSPDGRTVYVAVSDFLPLTEKPEDGIVAIDVASGEILRSYRAGGNPERIAISPDGKQIWAALEAIAQGVGIDAETGEELGRFPTGVEPEGVDVSPDGRWAYITGETSHTVTVIDTQGLEIVTHMLVGNRPRDVVFSPDSTRAYASAEIGGTISVIDVSQHRVIATISLGLDSRPVEVDLSPDGTQLFVAGGGTSAVYVVDTATGEGISYTPYARNTVSRLSLVDTATGEVAHVIKERMGRRPWGVTVSPDGNTVYTANGLSDSVSVIDTGCMCVTGEIAAGRGAHSIEVGHVE